MCGKGRSRGKRRACGPAPFHTERRSIRSSRPAQRLPPTADHPTSQLLNPHPLPCLSLLLINSQHCRRYGTFHPFPPTNDVTCRCCRPYPPSESRARLSQLPVQMSTLLLRQEMIGLQDNFTGIPAETVPTTQPGSTGTEPPEKHAATARLRRPWSPPG